MRPVTRGAAATYVPNAALTPVLQELETLRAASAEARTSIAAITAALAGHGLELPRKRPRDEDVPTARADILAARPALDAAYTAARDAVPLAPARLTAAAGDLVVNLTAEMDANQKLRESRAKRLSDGYGLARGDLIANIGEFCSYCEIPLAALLAIEHMLPKSQFPLVALSWTNFLLACGVCNGHKTSRPDRAAGEAAAAALAPGAPLYPEADVQAGALSTYVWPSDAVGYPRWEDVFTYRMALVRYDTRGRCVSATYVAPEEVARWAFGATQLDVVSEAGYAITARITSLLVESAVSYFPVRHALEAGAVSPELAATLGALPPDVRIGGAPAPAVAVVAPDRWRLTQTLSFQVDTTNQARPVLFPVVGGVRAPRIQDFDLKLASAQRSFLDDLARGVLPPAVADALRAAPYLVDATTQHVVITAPERVRRDIAVTKSLDVVADGDFIQVMSVRAVDLELRVVPRAGAAQARAARVVDELKLNAVDRTDTEFSDRRVLRRTRAFLSALDAVRRLDRVVTSGGGSVAPAAELYDLIARTAVATGYWSVWRHVFATYLAEGVRDGLSAFLPDVRNFPGTR